MGKRAVLEIAERVKRVSHRVKNTGNMTLYRKGIRIASRIRSAQKELEAEILEEEFMRDLQRLYSRAVPVGTAGPNAVASTSGYEPDLSGPDPGSEPGTLKGVGDSTDSSAPSQPGVGVQLPADTVIQPDGSTSGPLGPPSSDFPTEGPNTGPTDKNSDDFSGPSKSDPDATNVPYEGRETVIRAPDGTETPLEPSNEPNEPVHGPEDNRTEDASRAGSNELTPDAPPAEGE